MPGPYTFDRTAHSAGKNRCATVRFRYFAPSVPPVPLWPAVVEAAKTQGVRFIRIPREPLANNVGRARATLSKVLLGVAMTGGASYAAAKRAGLATADHFRGISSQGSRSFELDLIACIRKLAPGMTELMVHPGYVDSDLRARDRYLEVREVEVRALTSSGVRAALNENAIQLERFAQRWRSWGACKQAQAPGARLVHPGEG